MEVCVAFRVGVYARNLVPLLVFLTAHKLKHLYSSETQLSGPEELCELY